jgi:hypothetical protein
MGDAVFYTQQFSNGWAVVAMRWLEGIDSLAERCDQSPVPASRY